jgi:hypothetical protein
MEFDFSKNLFDLEEQVIGQDFDLKSGVETQRRVFVYKLA